jgi:hypothetical protein
MHYPDDLVLVKSQKGNDEVVTRKHGLTPRIRQMLILIDGHRDFAALSKLIGAKEAVAYAMALENEGFVARVSVPSTASVLSGPETVLETAAPAIAPPAPSTSFAPPPSVQAPAVDFATMRHRIERLLHETLGPFADDISVRVEKARTVQDLRDLQQSIVLIVEAVRGKSAAAEFLQKVGKF